MGLAMAARVDELMGLLARSGGFRPVERLDYTGSVSAEDLLVEARAVGEFRAPSFVIDKGLQFAYENIAKWMVGDPSMLCMNPRTRTPERGDLKKGIYLAGRTGCGKTWALEIFAYLARAHGFKYRLYGKDCGLVMQAFRTDAITGAYMQTGDLTPYIDAKVLVLNDLGTEPSEVLYMGNRVDVVRQVLEIRADNPARITFVTSNLPLHMDRELAERYGDRVASRLVQMCNYMEIKGEDKRR